MDEINIEGKAEKTPQWKISDQVVVGYTKIDPQANATPIIIEEWVEIREDEKKGSRVFIKLIEGMSYRGDTTPEALSKLAQVVESQRQKFAELSPEKQEELITLYRQSLWRNLDPQFRNFSELLEQIILEEEFRGAKDTLREKEDLRVSN